MLDALFWACISAAAAATALTVIFYIAIPWPAVRLSLLLASLPLSYLVGAIAFASAADLYRSSTGTLMNASVCVLQAAAPCTEHGFSFGWQLDQLR